MPSVVVSHPCNGVMVITIDRPAHKNAVNRSTATELYDAFARFAASDECKVAIRTGASRTFCAGADLKAISVDEGNLLSSDMDDMGPMGPTRMALNKPVIAAIEGYAVAGGLELAAWCDLRVAAEDAKLGILCRLRGVPLIDGGTVRLPALIGLSRATDLILTGRLVDATEAHGMGLVNYLSPPGQALDRAISLAKTLLEHPNLCMTNDRLSSLSSTYGTTPSASHKLTGTLRDNMQTEFDLGLESLAVLQQQGKVEAFIRKAKL